MHLHIPVQSQVINGAFYPMDTYVLFHCLACIASLLFNILYFGIQVCSVYQLPGCYGNLGVLFSLFSVLFTWLFILSILPLHSNLLPLLPIVSTIKFFSQKSILPSPWMPTRAAVKRVTFSPHPPATTCEETIFHLTLSFFVSLPFHSF